MTEGIVSFFFFFFFFFCYVQTIFHLKDAGITILVHVEMVRLSRERFVTGPRTHIRTKIINAQ